MKRGCCQQFHPNRVAARNSATDDAGSTIETSIGITKLTVKNAAPRTAFALFGALLLVVTMIQGRPSVTLDSLSKWQAKTGGAESLEDTRSQNLVMRGDGNDLFGLLAAQGIDYERAGTQQTLNAHTREP